MRILSLPWLEFAFGIALFGSAFVSRLRDPMHAARVGVVLTGTAFVCAFLTWLSFYIDPGQEQSMRWSIQPALLGRRIFRLDELSAPLVPAIALLHFLVGVATPRVHMRRFSFSWSLVAEAIRIATFSCQEAWVLIGLLVLATLPPFVELRDRGRPVRAYFAHMALFSVLLVVGWAAVGLSGGDSDPPAWWATLPLLAAVLIGCGTVPAHCWITDWFEHSSFGIALLTTVPLSGVLAAVRLLLPVAPGWVLHSVGIVSLLTAVYAAGMATIQRDSRRFYAFLLIGNASLVLVGLEFHTELSLTGSLCLWFSVILSLGCFGMILRALEGRFGRLSLISYLGLYEHAPTLAVCFLLAGLAGVGFPGTLGFISAELLVDSALGASPYVGMAVVTAAALNGIAVLRAYFLLFTGSRHPSTVFLGIGRRERFAFLILAALILGGGFFPQPGVTTRQKAAREILDLRGKRFPDAVNLTPHSVGRD